MDQHGRPFASPQNGINPCSFGEVIATITYLNGFSNNNSSSIWDKIDSFGRQKIQHRCNQSGGCRKIGKGNSKPTDHRFSRLVHLQRQYH